MKIPDGAEGYKHGYWELKRVLYGLQQSDRL